MADKSWKRAERDVGAIFGVNRVPLSGSNSRHNTSSDTLHPRLYIEVKRDKKCLGKRLLDLLQDTTKKAKKEKKIPMVVLKSHGKRGFYALVKLDDIQEIAREMKI